MTHICGEVETYKVTIYLNPSDRCGWTAWAQGEFRFRQLARHSPLIARRRREADLKKQGKSGSDAGAPREASDSILCERGKPADEPESPPCPPKSALARRRRKFFSNEIRTAIYHALKRDEQRKATREIWLRLNAAKGRLNHVNPQSEPASHV